jgi:hypothetical protein
MPLDYGNFEFEKKPSKFAEDRRIYVCEDGNVRIETRHFRQTFAPEEFIALMRRILSGLTLKNEIKRYE